MDFCSSAERIYSFQKKYISRVSEQFVSPSHEISLSGVRRDPCTNCCAH
nr:MAG TPA: hypothetical protein [Caudoviricetes sp.]DAZ73375.1 MAG TPA: hypothetical protein [Caudoviricetes sp.]